MHNETSLEETLKNQTTGYIGLIVHQTACVGSLLPLMILKHFQKFWS